MEQWKVNAWNLGKCGVRFGGDLLIEQFWLSLCTLLKSKVEIQPATSFHFFNSSIIHDPLKVYQLYTFSTCVDFVRII